MGSVDFIYEKIYFRIERDFAFVATLIFRNARSVFYIQNIFSLL